jgi:hypothetical protein
MIYKPNFFVITGGPGVGKTTLLEQLQQRGYRCVPEVARDIIREQIAQNGDALPWGNIQTYTHLMLFHSVNRFKEYIPGEELTFFDRGIPDVVAYVHITQQICRPELQQAPSHYRYNTQVFILPPWAEIYHTDTERKQTYREAVETYNAMYFTYQACGYTLTIVPKTTPEERADFVLQQIQLK